MAFIIKDRIKEGTTTEGTVDLALSGAAATFDPFGSYMADGDTTYYAVVHTSSGVDECWNCGFLPFSGNYSSFNQACISYLSHKKNTCFHCINRSISR